MQECGDRNVHRKVEYLEEHLLHLQNYTKRELEAFKHTFSHVKSEFKRRWLSVNNKESLFKKRNEKWLEGTMVYIVTNQRNPFLN